MSLNYFAGICFLWAAVGLLSRALIARLGKRWNDWEEHTAYAKNKPGWLYAADAAALLFAVYTWYRAFTSDVRGAWVIAALLSLLTVKALAQMCGYARFRAFIQRVLHDQAFFRKLNLGVAFFSIGLIALGLYYLFSTGNGN